MNNASLPKHLPVPRGMDHLVIAGHNLGKLAQFYAALGFTVGARNVHPWGTENHIIQFGGVFLELISVADGAAIPEPTGRNFSFGAFVRDFLKESQGLAMLALESLDAKADAAAFKAERIGDFAPFFFERQGKKADGSDVRVAFSLAFARMPKATHAGFFVCQQHEPQNFWNPAAQRHANGVTGIESVTMVADDPSDCHEFLGAFINQREMRATSYGLEIETGRGRLDVLSPEAFRYRFGEDAPVLPGRGPQFAAVTFRCNSAATLEKALAGAQMPHTVRANIVTIPSAFDHGIVLAFMPG